MSNTFQNPFREKRDLRFFRSHFVVVVVGIFFVNTQTHKRKKKEERERERNERTNAV